MRCAIIDPEKKTIEISNIRGHEDIYKIIGANLLTSIPFFCHNVENIPDSIFDCWILWLDDSFLMKEKLHTFLIPSSESILAGKSVLVGKSKNGEMRDLPVTADDLNLTIRFLSLEEQERWFKAHQKEAAVQIVENGIEVEHHTWDEIMKERGRFHE